MTGFLSVVFTDSPTSSPQKKKIKKQLTERKEWIRQIAKKKQMGLSPQVRRTITGIKDFLQETKL